MEIVPNVHLISGLRGANAYLLTGETLTLVDAGMPGAEKTILAYIEGLGLDPNDLARIVVTHHHLDHTGSAAALKARTSAQVLAHPGDEPFVSGEQALPPASNAAMRILSVLLSVVMPKATPVGVDLLVQDGDQLDILGGATVVHVPGHTPGSTAVHFPAEGLLICGDTIDHRRDRLGPPPKPFTADMDQAVASIGHMAGLAFEVLCPGHGAPIIGGAGEQVRAMVQDF